jgi:transcriptional regulator with XRE-family HTH domain
MRMLTAMTDTSITRTLGRALLAIGSLERLAEYLGVSERQLLDWLEGERKPPTSVYVRALDLVSRGRFISRNTKR